MKKRAALAVLSAAAIVLEILPYGAVLNFLSENGTVRKTFSYFDLTPYGYANFGPLLTAVLTSVLILLCVIYLFAAKNGIRKAISIISGIAVFCSLMPLLYGLNAFSLTGASISALLAAVFILSLFKSK